MGLSAEEFFEAVSKVRDDNTPYPVFYDGMPDSERYHCERLLGLNKDESRTGGEVHLKKHL